MLRFLVYRTMVGLVVLWLVSMSIFALFFVAPNNVARTLGGRQATPEVIAAIEKRLGFVNNALHGNLGYDYYYQLPVTDVIKTALPITLSLAVGAAIIWLAMGVF